MFDKTFKISIKDLILFATIFIGFGVTKERLTQVEEKVDVIYGFYVNEGMKKASEPVTFTPRLQGILNYQELKIRKK